MGAVLSHPDALIENLFASGPTDFLDFGVYTCRLYKDGEWVDVVTDTRIPCAVQPLRQGLYPPALLSIHPSAQLVH